MSDGRRNDAPRSVDEALRRSASHARKAMAEALLAAHALLDAVAIAATGRAASAAAEDEDEESAAAALGKLARRIESTADTLRGGEPDVPEAWARAVLGALDGEIARWEKRSQDDRDARAVLRAFLGLREILWEFGLRDDEQSQTRSAERARTHAAGDDEAEEHETTGARFAMASTQRRRAGRARVQRIDVDG